MTVVTDAVATLLITCKMFPYSIIEVFTFGHSDSAAALNSMDDDWKILLLPLTVGYGECRIAVLPLTVMYPSFEKCG